MFYGDQVQDTRQFFCKSWQKYQSKMALEPLEKQIVQVILEHPEYHKLIEQVATDDQPYFPELGASNPFLHMGLHLAIRDQVHLNQPAGITEIYQKLLNQLGDQQTVEHQLMTPLAQQLWQAQKNNELPDAMSYLENCKKLLKSSVA